MIHEADNGGVVLGNNPALPQAEYALASILTSWLLTAIL